MSVIHEAAHVLCPVTTVARTYADDISAVCSNDTKEGLAKDLLQFHAIVRACTHAGCGDINDHKTFTFGHHSLIGVIQDDMAH